MKKESAVSELIYLLNSVILWISEFLSPINKVTIKYYIAIFYFFIFLFFFLL